LLAACHLSAAQTYTESVIYSFPAYPAGEPASYPQNAIQASDGNLYGAAGLGGSSDRGAFFRVTPGGAYDQLFDFCLCPEGSAVSSPVVEGGDGNFYLIAQFGGTGGGFDAVGGTAFMLTPSGGYTALHYFCQLGGNCLDGETPSSLILGADGNFYGTTEYGGPATSADQNGLGGIIYQLTPSGTFTTIYSFCALPQDNGTNCPDGTVPNALLQGSDGNFYGVTQFGGAYNTYPGNSQGYGGTIFRLTPSGAFTTLHSFCKDDAPACADGSNPVSESLMQASATALYGTTGSGGAHNAGTIFKIDAATGFTKLYDFCSQGGKACTDGADPTGRLIQGTDGNLYGVADYGGSASGQGTIFKMTPSGAFSTIYTFCEVNPGCKDGGAPQSAPVWGADGNLYGSALVGGNLGGGAIYKVVPSPAIAPSVQLTLNQATIAKGDSVTLNWQVPNAWSITAQQCYAFINSALPGDASYGGNWTGKQSGTISNGTYSSSATITPTAAGTFTYALTCAGTISGFATLTVTGVNSTTGLTASPSQPTAGQSVTLTATITGSGPTPTGSLTFYYGSDVLYTSNLNNGVATFTASTNGLPTGTYPITAKYSGDSNYNASSGTDSVTLEAAPTVTTLTASPTTVTPPGSVTLTATVQRSATGATGTPTGSVTFYANGSDALATVKVNSSGVATITASSKGYPAGKYPITAKYLGDASDTSSTSSAVSVTLN
jgi:uncharacterized repeat protein (TIGR03803 family)